MALIRANTSGGGSGTETPLWALEPLTATSFTGATVNISQSYTNFSKIRFYYKGYGDTASNEYYTEYPKETIDEWRRDNESVGSGLSKIEGGLCCRYSNNNWSRVIFRGETGTQSFYIADCQRLNNNSTNNNLVVPSRITGIS